MFDRVWWWIFVILALSVNAGASAAQGQPGWDKVLVSFLVRPCPNKNNNNNKRTQMFKQLSYF